VEEGFKLINVKFSNVTKILLSIIEKVDKVQQTIVQSCWQVKVVSPRGWKVKAIYHRPKV